MKDIFKDMIICPFCGLPTKIVWIHGHGQCAICKNVIDECCRGENQQSNNEQKKEDENSEIKDHNQNENDHS